MLGQRPAMSERILEGSRAVAPEHVAERHLRLRAGVDGAFPCRIHIVEVDIETHRRAAVRLRALGVHPGHFVGEHDDRVADPDLGVHDAPARTRHTHGFGRSERFLIEVDRARGVVHDHVRRHRVIVPHRTGHSFLLSRPKRRGVVWRLLAGGRSRGSAAHRQSRHERRAHQ